MKNTIRMLIFANSKAILFSLVLKKNQQHNYRFGNVIGLFRHYFRLSIFSKGSKIGSKIQIGFIAPII